ncbi:hypothetical protein [Pedobacter glucosidilyticus]|uniref:hypothetical protein n=1 Tax=Pedobacter glucosidilyticus TaxID=1122941 RepID=UPI0006853C11|nr:hypothetical protein [Pedobacter glucosidilyticus]
MIRKITFLFILFNVWTLALKGQTDTLKASKTLTLAALYNSNISYYGQVTSERLPYALLNATLRFPSGLYFSVGSYRLFNDSSFVSEGDLGIGYDYEINDKLSVGLSYYKFFYPKNSPLLQAANTNNLSFMATYHFPWFKSVFSTDYSFGKADDIFMSLGQSKDISLFNITKNDLISIEPCIELVAGSRNFFETYTIERAKKGKGKNPYTGNGNAGNTIITTEIIETSAFTILAYNFKLPINYSRANYLAELSYQFTILGHETEPGVKRNQSFFGLAFYYQF